MNDAIERVPTAFGDVLVRHRRERKWTIDALATAIGLSAIEIASLERGDYGPTLKEFFHIASALREEPTVLFIDLVAARRTDPTDYDPYKSRPSDCTKLFRLGYPHDPGDFRELPTTFGSTELAVHAAAGLNVLRRARGQQQVDVVLTYTRTAWSRIRESFSV
jgi:transcriptional regulator with XRE-family HTH domain